MVRSSGSLCCIPTVDPSHLHPAFAQSHWRLHLLPTPHAFTHLHSSHALASCSGSSSFEILAHLAHPGRIVRTLRITHMAHLSGSSYAGAEFAPEPHFMSISSQRPSLSSLIPITRSGSNGSVLNHPAHLSTFSPWRKISSSNYIVPKFTCFNSHPNNVAPPLPPGPAQVTTKGGSLQILMEQVTTHGLPYRSGMLQSWNKFCFTTGYIEVAVTFPGPGELTQGYVRLDRLFLLGVIKAHMRTVARHMDNG